MANVPAEGDGREKKRAHHKRYYAETAGYIPRIWTEVEDRMVLMHEKTDRELSEQLHRSMKAIQNRRSRLKGSRW